jgi:hypothetical protein
MEIRVDPACSTCPAPAAMDEEGVEHTVRDTRG